ncbi:oligosaccharide flippase family protein [Nubsella zeaxanthinifaciens]|uniref:oligosaccharide flippase family protein n=1 Tax=Nubsella zeaxanthinifaciens TaxID=392412 RepID=UPI003D06A6BA
MSVFFKNTLLYSVGNVIVAVAGFVLLPVYANFMSVAEFGKINSLQTLAAVSAIFLSLALERALARVYYDYNEPEEKKIFINTVFISICAIGLVVLGITTLFSSQINRIFPSIPYYPFYIYTIIAALFNNWLSFFLILNQVKHKALNFLIITVIQLVITSSFILFYVIFLKQGALGYVKGTLFGTSLSAVICFVLSIKNFELKFSKKMLKNALLFSLPMFPNLISSWVLSLSDRIFIDNYFSQYELGLYSLGYKVASLISFVSTAFFMAFNPIFYDLANRPDQENSKRILTKYNNLYILIVSLLCGILFISCDGIIKILFGDKYINSIVFCKLFCISFAINQFSGVFNLMIYQTKKTSVVSIIVTIVAGINITFNYFLIPKYGAIVAVYNSILCSAVNFLLMYFYAKRNYYLKFDFKIIVQLAFILLVITLINLKIEMNGIAEIIIYAAAECVIVLLAFVYLNFSLVNQMYLSIFNKNKVIL